MKIGMPKDGRFGDFGGKYIPETLVPAIEELEENYQKIKNDESFQKELDYYLKYREQPTRTITIPYDLIGILEYILITN